MSRFLLNLFRTLVLSRHKLINDQAGGLYFPSQLAEFGLTITTQFAIGIVHCMFLVGQSTFKMVLLQLMGR
jgi:hypothetical protein